MDNRIRAQSTAFANRMGTFAQNAWNSYRYIPGLTRMVARWRLEGVPRPDGDEFVFFGPAPHYRVLLIGNGPAVGWGVLTHQLGLAGELSRVLTAHVEASVGVHVLARPQMKAADLLGHLDSLLNLSSYRAVVVTVGMNDAISRTPVREWEAYLTQALELIETAGAKASSVVFIRIQRVESVPAYLDVATHREEAHGLLLNQATIRVAAAKGAQTVQLSERQTYPDRYRDRRTYALWAREVASVIGSMPP